VALAVLIAVAAFALAMAIFRNPAIGLLAFIAGGAAPFVDIFRERRARLEKFEEQLPDAVDVMKRALRAGHPFNACIRLVAEDMDPPIAREFELTFADVNYGNDLRRALLGMLLRVPSSNLMAVVTAVLIQKETGGNLAEIFARISQVIRSRFQFGRKVRTLSAEGRLSAWILALVPIILFGMLWIITPAYLPPLLENPTGQKMLITAGVMLVVAVFWMRRIIRIDL
jgi:tight adherence protein B